MHAPLQKLPALPSPQRSRTGRERRGDAARKPILHVVMPGAEVARATPRKRETITAFLRRTGWASRDRTYGWQFKRGLPTVLEINGEAVLRRQWRTTRIAANDNVRFVSYPLGGQGGGAKQVIGLVALIAVSAFALWAGPLLAGGAGLLASGITAGITIGGSLLINALTSPKAGATNAPGSTQDQIYSVGAQGNTARLGQPLPVWYGRLKRFPDFAATPWGEFVGNDQYLNVLLSVSQGSLAYETLYIDDTPFWTAAEGIDPAFATAQVAFYEPGAQVTLFPVNVDASAEVTGQQLPDGGGTFGGEKAAATPATPGAWVGGFVANPAGTLAQSIAIDFVLPSGCFTVDSSNNNIASANVGLTAEYCPCDGAGAPTGSYTTLFSVTKTYATSSPIRDSIKVDVAPGRYLVRFRRDDAGLPSSQGSNAVVWAGLRSFLAGNNSFADVSTIAIRILATQSTQGSYKFGVLATRKLPVWNGSAFVTQATRNNGWAFLDAVSNANYGSELSLSKVDFNAVVNFAAGCDLRGDTFDYCFTSATAVPEAFDKILTAARARHFWLGDTISVVRDEWRDVPSMLLTDREIVRGSTEVDFTMLGEDDPDAVIIEYIDQNTWGPAQVQYPPDNQFFTATRAAPKRIDGIIDRDQAYRECAFYYLQSIYRRENVQIGTEYEGRAITFGSAIRVQSELPMAYGYGGAVVNVTGLQLTLNPAPSWADSGAHFIRLRRPNGKWFGPIAVTQGASPAIAILGSSDLAICEVSQGTTLTAVLAREVGGEDPSFGFGTADNDARLCVVLNGVPNGNQCTLNLVVDDERVHATDLGSPPVLPNGQFPTNSSVPRIIGLSANFGQGTAEPKLNAGWFPAAGAINYIAEISYDSGRSWQRVYEGQGTSFEQVVTLAALRLRVQAVGVVPGPYAALDLEAPTIEVRPGTVSINSVVQGIRYEVTTALENLNANIERLNAKFASLGSINTARNWLDKQTLRRELSSVSGVATAKITELFTVATSLTEALAKTELELTSGLGLANSRIDITNTSLTDLTQSVADQTQIFQSRFGDISGQITAEIQTRSTADGVLSGRIDNLGATVNNPTTGLVATSNATSVLQAQIDLDPAHPSAVSLKLDSLGATVNDPTTGVVSTANATSILKAQVNLDPAHPSAISGQLNTLNTTVGQNSAAIQVFTGSIDGTQTQFGIFSTIDNVTGAVVFRGVKTSTGVEFGLAIDGNVVVKGSLTSETIGAGQIKAINMAAQSITAQNGAIDTFAVKSLNIGDNAVTVPLTHTTISPVGGPTSRILPHYPSGWLVVESLSIPIETPGLAGKTVTVLINFVCTLNSGGSGAPQANLFARLNGGAYSNLMFVEVGYIPSVFPMTGAFTFIATGGVDTVDTKVEMRENANVGTQYIQTTIIWAEAAKR